MGIFNNIMYNNLYYNYLNNKTISIVGPSSCLHWKGLGSEIDNSDCVIRVNSTIHIKNEIDFGNKTNVLFTLLLRLTNLKNILSLTDDMNLEYLVHPYPETKEFHNRLFKTFLKETNDKYDIPENWKFHQIDQITYNMLCKNCIKTPNTGVICIYDILKNVKSKKLEIYGMDFYDSAYEYSKNNLDLDRFKKINKDNKHHNVESQRKYITKLISSFDNVEWLI